MKNTKKPDFLVVGLQKCGTYWVTALLDAHPEINCIPTMGQGQTGVSECHMFDPLGSIDRDGGAHFRKSFSEQHNKFFADLVPLLHKIEREELYDRFRERHIEWCNIHRKKRLIGEKTTEYIFNLVIIDYFYPEIKKICIARSPKDRIVSSHFQQVSKGRKKNKRISDQFIREYCERISQEYSAILNYDSDILCLTYEGLTNNPIENVTKLFNYLKVETSDEIVSDSLRDASFDKYSGKEQLSSGDKGKKRSRGDELADSHYRKGVVGDWENHLTVEQAAYVDRKLKRLQGEVFEKYEFGFE